VKTSAEVMKNVLLKFSKKQRLHIAIYVHY